MKLIAAVYIQLLLIIGLQGLIINGVRFKRWRWAFSEIYRTLKQ